MKKRAFLVYSPEEAEKNRSFIQMFQNAGLKQEVLFEYLPFVPDGSWYRQERLKVDFVLNRTRNADMSRWCQEKNIPVFHTADLVETANEKQKTLSFFDGALPDWVRREKWCPRSIYVPAGDSVRKHVREGFMKDGVIKSVDGHGGSEVFLLQNADQWEEKLSGKAVLIQERIDSASQDLRIYVLGREIYQAVLRTGRADFRSNHSLGGRAEPYKLSDAQKRWVEAFLEVMPEHWQGMFGIDFILSGDGQLIFNELEEMVGCRMLYACTSKDIVKDYITWLKGRLV